MALAHAKLMLFKYESNVRKDGTYPIVLRVTKDRKRKYISLKRYALPEQWDFNSNEFKHNKKLTHDWELQNEYLVDKLNKLNQIIKELGDRHQPFTLNQVEEMFDLKPTDKSVVEFWNEIINEYKSLKKVGQGRIYSEALSIFLNFDKKFKKKTFDDIDYTFVSKFLKQAKYVNEWKDTTISLYLRTLRSVLNKAIKIGIGSTQSYPFSNIYLTNGGNHQYFNINSELNHDTQPRHLPKNYLLKIRDATFKDFWFRWSQKLFMFSFYAYGMNFIDMGHLRKENIDEISNQLIYKRRKTGKTYKIAINSDIQSLLLYFSEEMPLIDDFLLPIVSTSGLKSDALYKHISNKGKKFNKYLKNLASELSIPAKMTSYYSRHSFAMALKTKGVPTSIISEALGHDKEDTTITYLDSFQNDEVAKASENLL